MAYSDADDMLRQFEARIEEQLAQADQLRSTMESVQATHEVLDGAVVVTVDSAGGLAGLRLAPAALRLAPEELAEEILACAKGAQAKLADRVGEAMAGALGAESETSQYVSQAYAERFGSAAGEEQKP